MWVTGSGAWASWDLGSKGWWAGSSSLASSTLSTLSVTPSQSHTQLIFKFYQSYLCMFLTTWHRGKACLPATNTNTFWIRYSIKCKWNKYMKLPVTKNRNENQPDEERRLMLGGLWGFTAVWDKCLICDLRDIKGLTCPVCRFPRCNYSYHGWFQTTNVTSLKTEFGRA